MSVEKSDNGIKLNIPFLKPTEKELQETSDSRIAVDMSTYKSLNDDYKGITVEQKKDKITYIYYENGGIKQARIKDPKTDKLSIVLEYSKLGTRTSETIYKDNVTEIIRYEASGTTHGFYDKNTGKLTALEKYDNKKRLQDRFTFDAATGFPATKTEYNPSTGKPQSLYSYNPKIKNQLLSIKNLDDRYPEEQTIFTYDNNNRRIKSEHFDENMNLLDTTFESINGRYIEYYDTNGNVTRRARIVMNTEIEPAADEIFNNFTTENIKKINTDNILEVFDDYETLVYDNISPGNIRIIKGGLIGKILQNRDSETRNAQLSHIADTLKDKLDETKNNSIELFCDNTEAVNKSLNYIKQKLDNITKATSGRDITQTIDVALNMIKNNDIFIDVANGKIDKITYQGRTLDCWLLAAVNSIAETENGKKLIENCLDVNPETGDVTVRLMGGEKEYLITNEELQRSGKLSKGDYDLRAIELAFQKYFEQLTPPQTIENNQATTAFSVLTGNKPIIAGLSTVDNSLNINGQLLNRSTSDKFKNIPITIFNLPESFDILEDLQPNIAICAGAKTSAYMSHQYWIKIDGDNITVKDPYNSKNEKTYSKEEFLKTFDGCLNVMVL